MLMIRKGVAAVVFRREREGEIKFLLLKRKKNWKGWEWLKGGCKKWENEDSCLKREIKEETGVSKFKVKKTSYFHKFSYPELLVKDGRKYYGAKHKLFLVEVFSDKIKFDKKEHSGFKWVDKETVLKLITWKDQKNLFARIIKLIK